MSTTSATHPYAHDKDPQNEILTLLHKELRELRAEMRAQEDALQTVRQHLADITTAKLAVDDGTVSRDLDDALYSEPRHDEASFEMDVVEQQRAEQERAARIVAALNEQLATESYDGAWAPQMQESIAATLQHAQFANSQLVDLACQASLCRVDVEHGDAEAEMGFLREFIAQAGFTDTEAYYSRQQLGEGTVHMTYFVSRDGQGLPLQGLDGE